MDRISHVRLIPNGKNQKLSVKKFSMPILSHNSRGMRLSKKEKRFT
jgi:hypothetical protein